MKNKVLYDVTSVRRNTVRLVATASADSLTLRESKLYSYVHCTGCLLLTENCCSTNRKFCYVTVTVEIKVTLLTARCYC